MILQRGIGYFTKNVSFLLDDDFLGLHRSAQSLDEIDARCPAAHVDGLASAEGEVSHDLTLRVEDQHAEVAVLVVGVEVEPVLCRIREDVNAEGFRRDLFVDIGENVDVIAVSDDLAGEFQYRVVGGVAERAAVLSVNAVGVVRVALVDVVRVELVEQVDGAFVDVA